jgi:hypothetical protein
MSSFTQQHHHDSGGPQHALEVVAAQQAEYDFRRLRRLHSETRPITAAYEDNLRQHLPPDLRFLTSDTYAVDRSVDALDRGRAGFDEELPFQPRFRLAVQTESARYANVTMPLAMSPEYKQTIAGHSGLDQRGPSRLLETTTEIQRRDLRSPNRSDRQNTDDLIAQFAPRYTTLPNDQNRIAVLQHVSAASGDGFTTPLARNQTAGPIRLQAGTNSDEWQFPSDVFQGRGSVRGIQSLGVPDPGQLKAGMISSELAFDWAVDEPANDSMTANLGALIAPGDKRTTSANTSTDFDRDGGYKGDGGLSSNPATNHSVQDALAAATEEVERLTSAVARAIHELERVRGSVQPALPALPLNFGSFRLS